MVNKSFSAGALVGKEKAKIVTLMTQQPLPRS